MISPKNKRTISICICASWALHGLFLVFLQTHSLWFCSSVEGRKAKSSRPILMVSHDQILKEAFTSIPTKKQLPYTLQSEKAPRYLPPPIKQEALIINPIAWDPTAPPLSLPLDELLFSDAISAQSLPPTFSTPSMPKFFLEGLILPSLDPSKTSQPRLETHLATQSYSSSPIKAIPQQDLQDPPIDPLSFLSKHESWIPEEDLAFNSPGKPASIPLPALPSFISLADLDTVNLSESFDAELTFIAKPDDSGYLFAITLLPKEDLHLEKIEQRITFLIDRSNTIQRERFIASKQAVLRALEELDEGDRFNIVVFDSKSEKLFTNFASINPSNIGKAEEFLENLNLGSFFATSDPYKPLLHTIPGRVQENEVHTAILLTDGATLASKSVRDSLLQTWTLQNQGRVSLFIVGMDSDPHSEALETLGTLNRGKFIASSGQRGLKRQILKLTKNIKMPVAKDLSSRIIVKTSNPAIHIHPGATLSPHLYLDQPYVILGSTDTLDDFLIFIQGRLQNQWLNIKKTISFVNAKKGNSSLKTAFHHYETLEPKIIR